MKSSICVIIVNWNTKSLLRDCLDSIYNNTNNVSLNVIVVDNGSEDNSLDMVRMEFPLVKIIANTENVGFSKANNQAIKNTFDRYVLLLNSDTIVLPGAIDSVVAFADSREDVGVIGCRILQMDGNLQPSCMMFPSVLNLALRCSYLPTILNRSRLFGRELLTWWNYNEEREVDVVQGSFFLVRRDVIDKVGLMDEDYFLYAEESDWCYRIKNNGWKIMYIPYAEIIHIGGASTSNIPVYKIHNMWGSYLLFIKKHNSLVHYYAACAILWLFFALRIPPLIIVGIIKPIDRKTNWIRALGYAKGIWRLMINGSSGLRRQEQ